MSRLPALVFDVNETLLSLDPIRVAMEEAFGECPPTGEWFARMLHGSLVSNHLGAYRHFDEIGVEALLAVAARRDRVLGRDDARGIVALMRSLPPHPDVPDALGRLGDAGCPMVALTNGSAAAARAQVAGAGLDPLISAVFSVEEVGRFKPDPAPYHHVAEALGLEISGMRLVAAHDWDCAGAMAAGAGAVFVERPGAVWGLPDPPPDLVVPDLTGLADALLS